MTYLSLGREIGIWLIASLLLWGMAYQGQRDVVRNPSQHRELRVRVPGWIVLLCGKPSPDNRVEVGRMVLQLSAFVMSILWVPLVLAKIDFQIRLEFLMICFLSNMAIGALVMVIATLLNK